MFETPFLITLLKSQPVFMAIQSSGCTDSFRNCGKRQLLRQSFLSLQPISRRIAEPADQAAEPDANHFQASPICCSRSERAGFQFRIARARSARPIRIGGSPARRGAASDWIGRSQTRSAAAITSLTE